MVNIDFSKGFLVDFSNFVLNIIKFSFNSLGVLVLKEFLQMQRILSPILVAIGIGFDRIEKVRNLFGFIEVNKMSETRVSLIIQHHI